MEKKERIVSIELLRIIAMLLIVMLHMQGKGGIVFNTKALSFQWFTTSFLETICVIGLNCFALITGFVNVGKKFKISGLLKLWFEVVFYSVVIYLIFVLTKQTTFSVSSFLYMFLPVFSVQYWYFSAYVIMFLFVPFLNLLLEKMDKKKIVFLVIAIGIIYGTVGFLSDYVEIDSFKLEMSFVWLAYLYVVGGVIRKYGLNIKFKGKEIKRIFYLIFFFVFILLNMLFGFILSWKNSFNAIPVILYNEFIFNIAASVCLLIYFAKLDLKHNKVITFFSSASFAVYLIHEQNTLEGILIRDRFSFLLNTNGLFTVLGTIGIAVAIYGLCSLIDYLRRFIFKLLKVDALTKNIQLMFEKAYKKVKL